MRAFWGVRVRLSASGLIYLVLFFHSRFSFFFFFCTFRFLFCYSCFCWPSQPCKPEHLLLSLGATLRHRPAWPGI